MSGPGPRAVRAFEVSSERFAGLVGAVEGDAWDRPTASEVSVRELVDHVLAGNEFAVRLLAGASADDARRGIDDVRLDDLAPGPAAEQVRASCAAQTAAFAAADPTRVLHHPSGDIDLPTFVRFRLGELVVHGWDVARALGADASLEPVSAAYLWELVEPHVEEMRAMGAYGEGARERLPEDASLDARLLDAFGRRGWSNVRAPS